MKLRLLLRKTFLCLFVVSLCVGIGMIALAMLAARNLSWAGGIYGLVLADWVAMYVAPVAIISFIGWALLTEYVLWFRLALVSIPILIVAGVFWNAFTSEWMESEFYVCADYNPSDQRIYFVSTQEALADDNPPAPPGRVKAEMWLERIKSDGSQREKLAKLPTPAQVDVNGFPSGGRKYYTTSRCLRLKVAPSHEKVAIEEYWGSVFVVDLRDNHVTTLISRGGSSTNELKYERGRPFVSWLPDSERLLLLVQRHHSRPPRIRNDPDTDVIEDVVVSTPAAQFQPTAIWVSTNTLIWAGPLANGLLMRESDGCKLLSLDMDTLTPGSLRAMPLPLCWDTIPTLQSNAWLLSEGEIVDQNGHVLRKLPDISGEYGIQWKPNASAWCNLGIIITDRMGGLQIHNPDTGETRTLLESRIDQRSRVKDKAAYQAYRQAKIDWQNAYEEKLRKEAAQYEKAK